MEKEQAVAVVDTARPVAPLHDARCTASWWGARRWARGLARRARWAWRPFDAVLVRWGCRYQWIASLYYLACSSAFRGEQRAFLAGRMEYDRELEAPSGTMTMLRRNTHRLEKGLLMRPRRPVFAVDYIRETMDGYLKLLERHCITGVGSDELQWSHDVLSEYFRATADHPVLDICRQQFAALPAPRSNGHGRLVPYARDLSTAPAVDYDDLLSLAVRRRSVRWFLPRPVPREAIDRCVSVAALSPSACNRQPFVFRVFDEPALVRRVGQIPYGAEGYAENIPAIVVVVGRLRAYFDERDRHLIYIDASLATMSLLYALESQGLSSCCINWPDVPDRERAMATLLGLESDERVVMLVAVGYPDPDGLVASSQKKPLDQLRRYNFE